MEKYLAIVFHHNVVRIKRVFVWQPIAPKKDSQVVDIVWNTFPGWLQHQAS